MGENDPVPPSQDVADKIVLDILDRLSRTMKAHPLTPDQNWSLAAITNKITQRTTDQMEEVEIGLSEQIMKIAQYSFHLGRSYASEVRLPDPDKWRLSGEMRSYD